MVSDKPVLNVGDVVVLKSGGPPMTIGGIDKEIAYCKWFDGNSPCEDGFNTATLQPAPGYTTPQSGNCACGRR